jgi:enoyl-CoA hydratase/carnithine racemase
MAQTLSTERDGRVLVVRVDNPPLNFMNRGMVAELDAITRVLERDSSIGAVVITGAKPGLYVTHYDVAEILDGVKTVGVSPAPALAGILLRLAAALRRIPGLRGLAMRTPLRGLLELHRIHDVFDRMNRSDKVFIAAINGPATGGGCELSLACDLRYMADGGFSIGLPEMTMGFNPGAGGTQRLTRLLGPGPALEMMLEGRTLSGAEALEAGLVHRLVAPDTLHEESLAAAHRLARRSPVSIRGLKRAVYEGGADSLGRGLAVERKWFMAEAGEPGALEAMSSFVEQVEEEEASPWADPDRIRAWQRGDAADMGSAEREEDG